MFKRIVTGILTFALAAFALCGCSFFTHDYERDMQQEIATVKSYEIVNTVLVETEGENGENKVEAKDYTYTTKKKTVYKQDLIDYVNSNASSLAQNFQGDPKGLYNYAVRMLVSVELVTNEVDALIESDKVEWGIKEQNTIKQNLYSIIDNTLLSLKNTILDERDQEQIVTDGSSSDSENSTTFPVKPDPTDDADDDDDGKTDPEPWNPSRVKWPGINGTDDERSLDREAMRRFLALIESRVKDDFRLDKPERKWLKTKINNELKAIDNLIDTQGIEYVYPVIADYKYPMSESDGEFGYIMYYLSGESLERSQKISAMQTELSEGVDVSYGEVVDLYRATVAEQQKLYDADIAAYNTAINGSSTTVLYHPTVNYFYVKHILLPFSDEQTAALTEFKNRPDIKNLQEDEKNDRIEAFRADLVDAIVCYPHKDGENDLSKPMSVDEVMMHVRSVMLPKESSVKAANDAFNDLIYLYNTDPGAFGNDKGYIVKYKLDEGEEESYMQEFADASRYMFDNLEVGQVYYEKVVTDYGVHIMYFASEIKKGAVDLNATTSPSGTETYYDLLEQPIKSNRESAAYNTWENNILSYNYNKYSKIYTENFSDLWED